MRRLLGTKRARLVEFLATVQFDAPDRWATHAEVAALAERFGMTIPYAEKILREMNIRVADRPMTKSGPSRKAAQRGLSQWLEENRPQGLGIRARRNTGQNG